MNVLSSTSDSIDFNALEVSAAWAWQRMLKQPTKVSHLMWGTNVIDSPWWVIKRKFYEKSTFSNFLSEIFSLDFIGRVCVYIAVQYFLTILKNKTTIYQFGGNN